MKHEPEPISFNLGLSRASTRSVRTTLLSRVDIAIVRSSFDPNANRVASEVAPSRGCVSATNRKRLQRMAGRYGFLTPPGRETIFRGRFSPGADSPNFSRSISFPPRATPSPPAVIRSHYHTRSRFTPPARDSYNTVSAPSRPSARPARKYYQTRCRCFAAPRHLCCLGNARTLIKIFRRL